MRVGGELGSGKEVILEVSLGIQQAPRQVWEEEGQRRDRGRMEELQPIQEACREERAGFSREQGVASGGGMVTSATITAFSEPFLGPGMMLSKAYMLFYLIFTKPERKPVPISRMTD